MKTFLTSILLLGAFLFPSILQAQRIAGPAKVISKYKKDGSELFAEPSTITELELQGYLGNCGIVSNLSFFGSSTQYGKFEQESTNSGLKKGLIIATGNVSNASGPNDSESTGNSTGGSYDSDLLTKSQGATLYDAAGFQFDLTATKEIFSVWAVFGSDEYLEYTGSNYNDIFAIFFKENKNGSGNIYENIAAIPGSTLPIKINTVNQGSAGTNGNLANLQPPFGSMQYSKYFINNPVGSQGIEYDGYTIPLLVQKPMIIGTTYHIKFAIADAGDAVFDSGLFITSDSFQVNGVAQPIVNFKTSTCGNTIAIDNKTKYADQYVWDFGDGTQSNEVNPTHTYQSSGIYPIILTSKNQANLTQTKQKNIDLDATIELSSFNVAQIECASKGSINLKVNTKANTILYKWSDQTQTKSLDANDCVVNFDRNDLEEGSYSLEVTAKGEVKTFGPYNISNPSKLISVSADIKPSCTNQNFGQINLNFGLNKPFNIDWSQDKTLHNNSAINLAPGNYQVSITDNHGCVEKYDYNVPETMLQLNGIAVNNANCKGDVGEIQFSLSQSAYTKCDLYNASNQLIQTLKSSSDFHFTNLALGEYSCKLSDENGCESNLSIEVPLDKATESKVLSAAINEGTISKIIISSKYGILPLTYQWSDGFTGNTRLNVNANIAYQITITDAIGCTEVVLINKANPHKGLSGLIAFPVPGNQYVNIRSQNETEIVDSNLWTCIITDANGKVIKLEKNVTQDGLQLNTSSLPNGLYFVHIQSSTDKKVLVLPVLHR